MESRFLGNVHFIRVRGTLAERAVQHAMLLKDPIRSGALPALVKKNEWMIRRAPGLLVKNKWIQNIAVYFYRNLLMPILGSSLSASEREGLERACKEIQFSFEDGREILLQPDGLMLLVRSTLMKHFLPEWIPGGLPGCSSGVALKGWTKDGKILAGRNFDYLIVGPWEKNTTVVFAEPTESGEIPYTFLTSAGVHSGGITAMNREGLAIFTHAHFGKKVSLFGRPVVPMGDEIIRKATTIGQAVDLARKYKPCSNWAFVMTSAKENQAAVIEWSQDKVHVRYAEDGFLAHTNYFHDKDLQRNEALLSGAYCEDLKGRICRMKELLEPHRGQVEPAHFSSVLGDHVDYYSGEERVFGNTLSVITTIKSAVFDPENLRFWIGNRDESPMGLGNYIEVDVEKFWNQSPEDYEKSMTVLPGYQPKNPDLVEGVKHYRNAYRCYHMLNHEDDYQYQALSHLRKAVAAYPSDAHLWVQAGFVAFKLREFKEARTFFEGSLSKELSPHVAKARDLYLARCLDLLGERKSAIELYSKHIHAPEPKIRKAFKKGIKRPYKEGQTLSVLIDLQYPDTFQY